MDYIDIYYIHWPLPWLGLYVQAYGELMKLVRGIKPLAKSATPSRWRENLAAADLHLPEGALATLDRVPSGRMSKDPKLDPEY